MVQTLERPQIAQVRENHLRNEYFPGLLGAIHVYNVTQDSASHPLPNVLTTSIGLLHHLKMDPAFLQQPEKGLFSLAVADSWLDAGEDIREKNSLLGTLKLLSYDSSNKSSYSLKVSSWRKDGSLNDSVFDPQVPISKYDEQRMAIETAYLNRFESLSLAAKTDEAMRQWGNGTLLHSPRTHLGITPDTEKAFDIVVVDVDRDQMIRDLGFGGIFYRSSRTLVTP